MPKKTISAYLEYLATEKKSSSNTVAAYRRDLNAYIEYLQTTRETSLAAATPELITDYVQALTDAGKSPASIARCVSSIRSLYQYLILKGQIKLNPAKTVVVEHVERKMPKILTNDEVDLLLSQPVCNCPKGYRDKAMLELMYATGIKVSELVELNVGDVNVSLGVIWCRTPKNERMIPMYSTAAHAVEEYITKVRPLMLEGDTEAVFLNINGTRLTRQGFWKIIKDYAESAGIADDITPQTIRHSFASHLLENGADLKSIQEMLGHTDISSTQFYARIIKNKYKNVYNKFHPRA